MTQKLMLIERAFQLARSGEFTTITQLKGTLRQEGYEAIEAQLSGKTIRAQLRRMIAAAPSKLAVEG